MRCSRKCKKQSYPSIYSIGGKQDTQKSVNSWEHIQSLTTSRKLSLTRSPCCAPVAVFQPIIFQIIYFHIEKLLKSGANSFSSPQLLENISGYKYVFVIPSTVTLGTVPGMWQDSINYPVVALDGARREEFESLGSCLSHN